MGRMQRRIQVDSRCECDTEIMAQEKKVGDSVMMCKARGCETVWVHATPQVHKIDADLHSFTPLAWIMSLFLAIGHVIAVNPM